MNDLASKYTKRIFSFSIRLALFTFFCLFVVLSVSAQEKRNSFEFIPLRQENPSDQTKYVVAGAANEAGDGDIKIGDLYKIRLLHSNNRKKWFDKLLSANYSYLLYSGVESSITGQSDLVPVDYITKGNAGTGAPPQIVVFGPVLAKADNPTIDFTLKYENYKQLSTSFSDRVINEAAGRIKEIAPFTGLLKEIIGFVNPRNGEVQISAKNRFTSLRSNSYWLLFPNDKSGDRKILEALKTDKTYSIRNNLIYQGEKEIKDAPFYFIVRVEKDTLQPSLFLTEIQRSAVKGNIPDDAWNAFQEKFKSSLATGEQKLYDLMKEQTEVVMQNQTTEAAVKTTFLDYLRQLKTLTFQTSGIKEKFLNSTGTDLNGDFKKFFVLPPGENLPRTARSADQLIYFLEARKDSLVFRPRRSTADLNMLVDQNFQIGNPPIAVPERNSSDLSDPAQKPVLDYVRSIHTFLNSYVSEDNVYLTPNEEIRAIQHLRQHFDYSGIEVTNNRLPNYISYIRNLTGKTLVCGSQTPCVVRELKRSEILQAEYDKLTKDLETQIKQNGNKISWVAVKSDENAETLLFAKKLATMINSEPPASDEYKKASELLKILTGLEPQSQNWRNFIQNVTTPGLAQTYYYDMEENPHLVEDSPLSKSYLQLKSKYQTAQDCQAIQPTKDEIINLAASYRTAKGSSSNDTVLPAIERWLARYTDGILGESDFEIWGESASCTGVGLTLRWTNSNEKTRRRYLEALNNGKNALTKKLLSEIIVFIATVGDSFSAARKTELSTALKNIVDLRGVNITEGPNPTDYWRNFNRLYVISSVDCVGTGSSDPCSIIKAIPANRSEAVGLK